MMGRRSLTKKTPAKTAGTPGRRDSEDAADFFAKLLRGSPTDATPTPPAPAPVAPQRAEGDDRQALVEDDVPF